MLNVLSVLYKLSKDIDLNEIDARYPFHPSARIRLDVGAPLQLGICELVKFWGTLSKCGIYSQSSSVHYCQCFSDFDFVPDTNTECFFLTLHCQHEVLLPTLSRYVKIRCAHEELEQIVVELEQDQHQWESDPEFLDQLSHGMIQIWKENMRVCCLRLLDGMERRPSAKLSLQPLKKKRFFMETALMDESFLSEALHFCQQQLSMLLRLGFPDE